jgi:tRNA (guanine-N7-)-methyltransferase
MTAERRSRSTEAFFGRRRGKTIRPLQAGALADVLPGYRIDLAAPPPQPLAALFEAPVTSVRLEIGFGGGEHLLHAARLEPASGFIGVEPFVNGMARLMLSLGEAPLANIRVYGDDATRVLDWLPSGAIDTIDLFYPDPWPKKKHWKRRFVGKANLDRFARVLRPGGRFRFASDIDTYVNWTLLHCRAHGALEWLANSADDWRNAYPDWPGTRYEAKALREGRQPAYLTFVRKHDAG